MISFARAMLILSLLTLVAFVGTGCETATEDAGTATKNVIKEVNEAYGNVKESVDETKTWVNTKVDQAEQATEDVQKAAESLNNAVNSLKEFGNLGGKNQTENTGETEPPTTPEPQLEQ